MRNAILYNGKSVTSAATTLYDHKIGRTLPRSRSGPPTLLSEEEETDLVSFLIESADIGYPKAILDVIAMAQRILATKGIEQQITNGWWWQGFCKRHSMLTSKKLHLCR